MGELLDYFASKYKKKTIYSEDQRSKTLVRNTILKICEDNLEHFGDVLTFEVLPKDLSYAVIVIQEEPLKSRYDIHQISKSLFQASMKVVEF